MPVAATGGQGASWERACAGKAACPSESGAAAALRVLQRARLFRTGGGVQPYLCPYCAEWHLGHARGTG